LLGRRSAARRGGELGQEESVLKIVRLLRHAAKLWRRPALGGACNMTGPNSRSVAQLEASSGLEQIWVRTDVSSVAICGLAERGMCLIIDPVYAECDTDRFTHPLVSAVDANVLMLANRGAEPSVDGASVLICQRSY